MTRTAFTNVRIFDGTGEDPYVPATFWSKESASSKLRAHSRKSAPTAPA